MTSEDVQAIVMRELETWRPPEIAPGSTLGVPWDAARYRAEIELLRAALVVPRQQRFALRETYEQVSAAIAPEATYWIVAATPSDLVWFDEVAGEFGLGEPGGAGELPVSIGVRGDLVGVFAAR